MVRRAAFASFLAALAAPGPARAAEYYVAPMGSGSACTMAAPCGRVESAQTLAAAGDTVWIRGGTYTFAANATVGVAFSKSGASNNRIKYFASMGEIPVFDLSNGQPNARVTGLDVTGSWIHIRGLEVRGVQQYMSGEDSWGVRLRGSNNVIEQLNVHHNEAPGIFITSGANNLILNCDSHHNYDVLENGGSGDGFGCHSTGAGNVISGCRGFSNSDDGYDFINAPGVCTVEKSWAFLNGYVPDTTTAAGNGAGFKAGGFGSPPTNVPNPVPRHVVRQCIAFGNRAQGFYANHHPGGLDFFNNLAFRNGTNFNMLTDTTSDHKLRNNIAMMPGTAITELTGGTETFNSWTLSVTANSMDFLSLMESEATAARQADGTLPNVNFARLAAGSDLIDKGEDVGLPFSGSAPDLGPFETGLTAGTGGMGGTSGSGGSATGGVAGTSSGGASGGTAGASSGGAPGGSGGAATGGVATGGGGGAAGVVTGGSTSTGGIATGGVSTGGSVSGSAGAPATGGVPSTGGSAGASDPDVPADDGGCGCRTGARSSGGLAAMLASLLAFAARAVRRRRFRR
jgi:parallel beta-helix repeat protein